MELSTIITIIIAIIIIIIVTWLFRTLLKFVLIAIFVYFAFHVGFVWGFDDINKFFHLDKFLKEEASQTLESKYSTLEEKRAEFGIVNTDEMKRVVDQKLIDAWEEADKVYESIDKEALIKDLQEQLDAYTKEEIEEAVEKAELELKEVNNL